MLRINKKEALLAVSILLLLPLFSMLVVPFFDTSEPRYAEVARIMQETGDWITPWFSPGVPFWGKPPLSFWAQALSMKMLGQSEFATRLPSWLCLLISNAVIFSGLRTLYGARTALCAVIVYSSCALVYVSSGAVLTDPFLTLGTNLSLIAFALMVQQASLQLKHSNLLQWQFIFFLGLVIGLLAKGPLALVLCFAPITIWYLFNLKNRSVITKGTWLKGFTFVAVLSLPWYLLAEIKTPGFLDYFIVGEHFKRFLDPGWSGDLYGTAHKQAYGTIWIYWLQASFPWGVTALATLIASLSRSRLRIALTTLAKAPLFYYWLASALFTPLFFSFSANILWTYLLPALVGFSVLVAMTAVEVVKHFTISKRLSLTIVAIVPTVMLCLSIVVWVTPNLGKTERELLRYVAQQKEISAPIYYLNKAPFSAQFYTSGKVKEITLNELAQVEQQHKMFYLAIPKNQVQSVEELVAKPLNSVYQNKRYLLMRFDTQTE